MDKRGQFFEKIWQSCIAYAQFGNRDFINAMMKYVRTKDKAFPNLWTVAGGKLQDTDGIEREKSFLYHSVELCAVRELFEETGISVDYKLLEYLCSITTIWSDLKRVIISYYVVLPMDAKDIPITLDENQAYTWVTEKEIRRYRSCNLFIPDIGGEILDVFKLLKEERKAIFERILKNGG